MIILNEVSLQRGALRLLDKTSVTINPGRRIGVIGANGCGKSSLFKLLLGELSVDSGNLSMPGHWRTAHMAQEVSEVHREAVDYVLDGDKLLREIERAIADAEQNEAYENLGELYARLENIQGFDARYRAEQLMHGLGFTQAQTSDPVSSFSGGWRIRLNLAQALMCPSDLMLLDEPTNHLDLDATFWLEQWLKSYPGTLLIISHDRDFLDNVVDGIIHVEAQKCWNYRGGYSDFEVMRAERLMQQQALYEKQQQRKKEIQGFVAHFGAKASKAKQAQSRLKELARMEEVAPAHVDSPFYFAFPEGKKCFSALVNLRYARLGYHGEKGEELPILPQVSFDLQPGSRIGLLGPNGAGKSTLIKTLTGDLPLLSGERICGDNLVIGYFAQHQLETLVMDESCVRHIQRLTPTARELDIRSFLGGFDFNGDKALEPIEHFSGGEKARLALALIVWQKPNLLLLDEPTNHLDLEMRHALTEALQGYQGALVVISHDRHLLRNTVDQYYLVAHGKVEAFDGDMSDYHRWLKDYNREEKISQKAGNRADNSTATGSTVKTADNVSAKKNAAPLNPQKLDALNKKLKQVEEKLEKQQAKLMLVEARLSDAALYDALRKTDLDDALKQQQRLQRELSANEEEWISLQAELES